MLSSSLLSRLQYQHRSLGEITEGLTDTALRKAIVTGKWSIFENIVHLATYQHTFLHRVEQILENNNPLFGRYTAEADPLFHDNCTRRAEEIMEDLAATRDTITATITALSADQPDRTGLHPLYGPMDIRQWLHFFLLHEAHHLFTIFKLAAELRKG
jgi:uncharacterized damage-inducible protein DinB